MGDLLRLVPGGKRDDDGTQENEGAFATVLKLITGESIVCYLDVPNRSSVELDEEGFPLPWTVKNPALLYVREVPVEGDANTLGYHHSFVPWVARETSLYPDHVIAYGSLDEDISKAYDRWSEAMDRSTVAG